LVELAAAQATAINATNPENEYSPEDSELTLTGRFAPPRGTPNSLVEKPVELPV
jgi:hypothetical protein